MDPGRRMLLDASKALAFERARRPPQWTVSQLEASLRGGVPTSRVSPTGIPGWEPHGRSRSLGSKMSYRDDHGGVHPVPTDTSSSSGSSGGGSTGTPGTFSPPASPPCPPPFAGWADPPEIDVATDSSGCLTDLGEKLRVSNCSSGMSDFYRAAWCFLLENWDVVKWIFEINFGTSECIGNVLNHRTVGFYVACSNSRSSGLLYCDSGSYAAHSYEWPVADTPEGGVPGEGWITICMEHSFAKERLRAFRAGGKDKLCALIDLAATILHELTHICALNYDQDEDECETSFTTENTFRWAMAQRFPDSCDSSCCDDWCGDELDGSYMSASQKIGFDGGCVPGGEDADTDDDPIPPSYDPPGGGRGPGGSGGGDLPPIDGIMWYDLLWEQAFGDRGPAVYIDGVLVE